MRKILVSAALVVSFIGYLFRQRFFPSTPPAQTPSSANTNTSQPPTSNTNRHLNRAPPTVSTLYRDGRYTGVVADAFYGLLQVRATIENGRITDVDFLRSPDDRPNSIRINDRAMPLLRAEALEAQSADIDIVSGATESSIAFLQSLRSALEQAQ